MLNLNDKRLVEVKFSEDQLKRLAVNELLRDASVADKLEGKKISVTAEWSVFKWDDPEVFVTFTICEAD